MTQPEIHPLRPFLPENATVLFLGSFPPPKAKWTMDFYYPNFQNDMWRVFGLVFFEDKDWFLSTDKRAFNKDKLVRFLSEKGIAFGDTAQEVIRLKGNASDNFLEVVKPIDLKNTLAKIPRCETIVTTGEKATDTLKALLPPETTKPPVGGFVDVCFDNRALTFFRMPSTSRAYPKPLLEKAENYRRLFIDLGLR